MNCGDSSRRNSPASVPPARARLPAHSGLPALPGARRGWRGSPAAGHRLASTLEAGTATADPVTERGRATAGLFPTRAAFALARLRHGALPGRSWPA